MCDLLTAFVQSDDRRFIKYWTAPYGASGDMGTLNGQSGDFSTKWERVVEGVQEADFDGFPASGAVAGLGEANLARLPVSRVVGGLQEANFEGFPVSRAAAALQGVNSRDFLALKAAECSRSPGDWF